MAHTAASLRWTLSPCVWSLFERMCMFVVIMLSFVSEYSCILYLSYPSELNVRTIFVCRWFASFFVCWCILSFMFMCMHVLLGFVSFFVKLQLLHSLFDFYMLITIWYSWMYFPNFSFILIYCLFYTARSIDLPYAYTIKIHFKYGIHKIKMDLRVYWHLNDVIRRKAIKKSKNYEFWMSKNGMCFCFVQFLSLERERVFQWCKLYM